MHFCQHTVYARENILKHVTFGNPGIILRAKLKIFAPINMKLKTKRHPIMNTVYSVYMFCLLWYSSIGVQKKT